MEYPRTSYINGKTIVIGNTSLKDTEQVDIVSSNGTEIKINGIVPGSGSGAVPIDEPGDIKLNPGNLICVGDGTNTGTIEAEKLTIKTGDIIATQGDLEVVAGKVEVLNGNVEVSGSGNIEVKGSGNISTAGGNITAGLAGDIQTTTGDIVSGNRIYFEGLDIYHRTNNPVANVSYKDYKQLAGKNDNNVFTGANQFNDNTTEFADKVSVGTRDGGGLFTQNLALNSSGNIESKTINNTTQIQCGNINCGNGGDNEVRARVFNTRTNENNLPDGWLIEQALPNSPAQQVDKVLQIKAQEAGAIVTITPTDFVGSDPAIILDPNTTANGGKIYAASYTFGTTLNRFVLVQDLTGPLNDTLQINAKTASGKVEFRDDSNNVILDVKKTEIKLGNTIPISFGAYDFRPTQYYKDLTAFSFNHQSLGATNLIFTTNDTDWTNVNTGATNQQINLAVLANQGAWKLTFRQTGGGTLGQINAFRLMSDMCLSRANDSAPQVVLPSATAYSYEAYDGDAPIITMSPGFLRWNVYATFPQTSGNETANVRITMTLMPFFA